MEVTGDEYDLPNHWPPFRSNKIIGKSIPCCPVECERMSAFEYASGLISIVVGMAVARVLGGIGNFSAANKRAASDWIVAAWCLALLLTLVGWWRMPNSKQ